MAHAQENEAQFRHPPAQAFCRPQKRNRVEPVIDTPAPKHDLVVLPDTRHDVSQARALPPGRLARKPEGDHRDQLGQEGVDLVGVRVDPAEGGQRAEPEIPLALARTGEKITSAQTSVDDAGQAGHGPVLLGPVPFRRVWSTHLQIFQVVRVVDVDSHGMVGLPQLRRHIDKSTRGERDVGAVNQLPDSLTGSQAQFGIGMGT